MRKRILTYRKRVDRILNENAPDTDWAAVLEEHLIQVGFFQHERLIHLLVTLAFGFFTLVSVLVLLATGELGALAFTLLFFVLLVPYILHYYLLENEVQRMYGQYDAILAHIRGKND